METRTASFNFTIKVAGKCFNKCIMQEDNYLTRSTINYHHIDKKIKYLATNIETEKPKQNK